MTLRDYTHPDDIDENEALFRDMMAGLRDSYRLEKRFLCKDGQLVWGRSCPRCIETLTANRSTPSRWSKT